MWNLCYITNELHYLSFEYRSTRITLSGFQRPYTVYLHHPDQEMILLMGPEVRLLNFHIQWIVGTIFLFQFWRYMNIEYIFSEKLIYYRLWKTLTVPLGVTLVCNSSWKVIRPSSSTTLILRLLWIKNDVLDSRTRCTLLGTQNTSSDSSTASLGNCWTHWEGCRWSCSLSWPHHPNPSELHNIG